MSQEISNIEQSYNDFKKKVDECLKSDDFNSADWQDVYSRLGRLRERYKKEKPALNSKQRTDLEKTFEEDSFVKSMMTIRNVSEHAVKADSYVISDPDNSQHVIAAEASALCMFQSGSPFLPLSDGGEKQIDHRKNFQELCRRIEKAINRAKQSWDIRCFCLTDFHRKD